MPHGPSLSYLYTNIVSFQSFIDMTLLSMHSQIVSCVSGFGQCVFTPFYQNLARSSEFNLQSKVEILKAKHVLLRLMISSTRPFKSSVRSDKVIYSNRGRIWTVIQHWYLNPLLLVFSSFYRETSSSNPSQLALLWLHTCLFRKIHSVESDRNLQDQPNNTSLRISAEYQDQWLHA